MRSLLTSSKSKQSIKTFNNVKVTLLCGCVTILVLRGTIGMNDFLNTPYSSRLTIQDLANPFRQGANRVLSTLSSSSSPSSAAGSNSNDYSNNNDDKEEENDDGSDGGSADVFTNPNIRDWDEQRDEWMSQFAHTMSIPSNKRSSISSSSSSTSNLLLVTSSPPSQSESPIGDHYLLKSIKNKIDYARGHRIEIFYNTARLYPRLPCSWEKLPLLRSLMLAHPEIEWLWWIDNTAMFTDMSFEVPLDKYKNHSLVLQGWEEKVYLKRSWLGLNTGSFLLRNCQWSLDLLDAWLAMAPRAKGRGGSMVGKLLSQTLTARPPFEADDQSTLIYLLLTQKDRWASKVFFENSYHLHGHWLDLLHFSFSDDDDDDESASSHRPNRRDIGMPPFITHFVGCSRSCSSSYGDYSSQKCIEHMERSFNFGDNQVLARYGYAHRSLTSSQLKQTRNESTLLA